MEVTRINNKPLWPPASRLQDNRRQLHTRICRREEASASFSEHIITRAAKSSVNTKTELAFMRKIYWSERVNKNKNMFCTIDPKLLCKANRLGKGGNGVVYKVEANKIFDRAPKGVFVAVKNLNFKEIRSENHIKAKGRLIKEALKQLEVDDKNIIKVLAIDMENGCVVFEYAAKGDAIDYVERQPLDVKLKVLHDTAKGLLALHDKGIVHGDLKGANVLICDGKGASNPIAKIGDLGSAKIPGTDRPYQSKRNRGTEIFSSPELTKPPRRKTYTKANDMWSLGMMMADLLDMIEKMEVPEGYKKGNIYKYIKTHLKTQEASVTAAYLQQSFKNIIEKQAVPSHVQDGLYKLFCKCTDPDPAKRITVKDFVRELTAIQRKMKTAEESSSPCELP